jgi:phosphatidylinositol alpha-mannosyltransferase
MKIGLVTPYVYPLPGGVNQHVRHLYENLRLRGHDVRIITSSHGLQRASEGDVIRIGKGFSMPTNGSVGTVTVSPRYLSQVRDVLDREQFDLLHFHEPFVPFLSLIVLRLSTSVNVATFHAYGGFSPAYEFGSKVMGSYARRLHGRIAVSAAARHFIDRFFPGDYKVIPNGVDIARFERAVPIARWQDGTRNILFVGRFESRKGLLDLLKAYRILRKTGCPCRLLVVGTGPQEREARRYVMTRKMGGVHFLGRVSDEERDALFKTADVYVSPATGRESFGIVLLEAMAAGTAIVCSDIHGYKGVVRRDRDALLVPPQEPKALASAIGRLISDDELRTRMAQSGMGRAQEFSWERVTGKVEDYYGFVIRRLASQGALPEGFHAEIPQAHRPGHPGIPGLVDPSDPAEGQVVASASGTSEPR